MVGASPIRRAPIAEARPADPEVQGMCDSVKGRVEEKTGKKYASFEAKSHKTQAADAGANYFITVHVGGDENVDLFVIKKLSGLLVLQGVQESKG